MTKTSSEFHLRGVVHLIRPWGQPAGDLDQLRHGIASAPDEVLFHHSVQYQVRHPGADELPPDDFSAWIGGVVQDAETAERLAFVVQGLRASPEATRAGMLEVLDAIPEKRRVTRDAPEGSEFLFLSVTSLSYPCETLAQDGQAVVEALLGSDASVWFFHLLEEPWFGGGRAPLVDWLKASGYPRLAAWLEEAAGSGLPIDKARARLLRRWRQSRIGRRLAESTKVPEDVRREAGHDVVARLVRRPSDAEGAP